jgi:predicted  nucleic acid-binding Zn-ribbon protein
MLVYDDEKYAKELMDLRLRLKNVYHQNVELESHVKQVESKKRDKEAEFDRITMEKKVVLNNRSGKLETLDMDLATRARVTMASKMMEIPDYDKAAKEREGPLDSLVKKFEKNGYTVEQAFNLFDDNGDGILTTKEIRQGFRDQEILEALDSEIDALVKAIDKDANGVVSLEEWKATL